MRMELRISCCTVRSGCAHHPSAATTYHTCGADLPRELQFDLDSVGGYHSSPPISTESNFRVVDRPERKATVLVLPSCAIYSTITQQQWQVGRPSEFLTWVQAPTEMRSSTATFGDYQHRCATGSVSDATIMGCLPQQAQPRRPNCRHPNRGRLAFQNKVPPTKRSVILSRTPGRETRSILQS